jgi:predicted PurR-regulated permease PerM
MVMFDLKQQRAAALIFLLGAGIVVVLWPFVTGLIWAPVLYIVCAPLHRWLARWLPRPIAAGIVILVAILVVVVPLGSLAGLIAAEAGDLAGGVINSATVDRIRELHIGPFDVGAQLNALVSRLVSFLGTGALTVVSTLTRIGVQLTIAFFGLFYLLCDPGGAWRGLGALIPFSPDNREGLRQRFHDVTVSTLIGTFVTATIQGICVGLAFWVTGLPYGIFWGVVTVIVAILPVVGSGLIWGPAVVYLALEQRWVMAGLLAAWGIVIVGNVDNVIRPWVFRRYARMHPFLTVIGAFAGIKLFGLLGLLVGPLVLSYFFELIRMYRAEYLEAPPEEDVQAASSPPFPELAPVPAPAGDVR